MMRCKEISRLVSESLDHKPPLLKRMELWLHLAMCKFCGGFAREQRALRQALQAKSDSMETDPRLADAKLPDDALTRMRQTLAQHQSKDDRRG